MQGRPGCRRARVARGAALEALPHAEVKVNPPRGLQGARRIVEHRKARRIQAVAKVKTNRADGRAIAYPESDGVVKVIEVAGGAGSSGIALPGMRPQDAGKHFVRC